MKAVFSLVLVSAGLSACGQATTANDKAGCNRVAGRFEVVPATLVRGAEVTLELWWRGVVVRENESATAQLVVGKGDTRIEVDLPMQPDLGGDGLRAQLLNPFGGGAPSGAVRLQGRFTADQCTVSSRGALELR